MRQCACVRCLLYAWSLLLWNEEYMKTTSYDHSSHGWISSTWLCNAQIHCVQNRILDLPSKFSPSAAISICGDSSFSKTSLSIYQQILLSLATKYIWSGPVLNHHASPGLLQHLPASALNVPQSLCSTAFQNFAFKI